MGERETREVNETRERYRVNSRASFLFACFAFSSLYASVPLFIRIDQVRAGMPQQQQVSVRWIPDQSDANRITIEVSGLSATSLRDLQKSNWNVTQWQRLLSIHAGQGDSTIDKNLPAMLGTYRVESNILRFEPQFPLEPGIIYQAVFRPDQLPGKVVLGGDSITAVFQLPPRKSRPATVVSQIYPSAEVLPENLLKFYLHFSAPMSRGRIYDHIHLRDSAGKEIELPFLEIDEELWDPTMTRLTLFIDPGRIKRGVLPLEEVGPSLEAGKSYTLIIGREWVDGAGNPLKESFQKTFMVGQADRDPPDISQWKVEPPRPGTRESLTITFPEPMDHALAQRVIRVTNESGMLVEGESALEDHERRWRFIPNSPWSRGAYRLVVQTTIEDLAGNNIGKPFEVDLFEGVQRRLATSTVKLSFEVR